MGNSKLDNVVKDYQGCSSGALNSNFNQNGGSIGFTHDLNKSVGGLPERIGYVSAPEYENGNLVGEVTSDGRLMGKDGMCGGGAIKKKTSGKKNNLNNLPGPNLGLNNNSGAKASVILNNNVKKRKSSPKRKRSKNKNKRGKNRSKNKRKQKSKKNRKKNKSRKNRPRRQSGGDLLGVFTQDMSQRDLGCKQPNWDPKCI